MHHYITVTCSTLSDQAILQQIWRVVIPKEALSYNFLMHGLLALSARHLVCTQPSERHLYTGLAMMHQNLALTSFRPVLDKITPRNCNALFAFSTLVVVFAFAFPQSPGAAQARAPIEETMEIFVLLRDITAIVRPAWDWIEQGSLGPLIRCRTVEPQASVPQDVENALDRLEEHNKATSVVEGIRATYASTIQNLRIAFEKTSLNPGDRELALAWPIIVEAPYLTLLKMQQPMALIILAHYGVILHGMNDHWWSKGWGIRVIKAVSGRLDAVWQPSVSWAMEKVGMSEAAFKN